ncbi:unnamed protein product [Adineta steineri]|uniref:Amine oxidase domain-containing protein n=1 Tax=Adineta steineri TaxID=433720 RepID=A0A819I7Z1_9BILA|nr:unnamed protein product [Adineta steineri]
MQKQYCIVIIGAGIAGLSCAQYWIDNNIDDFIIVDAHDEIGGRCKTIHILENELELGVESLHGDTTNNPLYQLANQYQLLDNNHRESDRDDCYHDEDGESIDEDVIDEIRDVYDEILEKKVAAYPYENYPDISLGEFISSEFHQYLTLKKPLLDEDEVDEREKVINWLTKQHPYLNTIGSNQLNHLSVQGWNSFERLSNDHQTTYIQNGFVNLLEKVFVNKINKNKIELNTIVKQISIDEQQQYVNITMLKNNSQELLVYQAKHVVCTQSLGCLKQSMHEMFIPPLPYPKQVSIQKLGFGTINKIFLVFSQPFWDVDFERFHFLWNTNRSDTEWKLKCFINTPYDSQWCKSISSFYVHHLLSNVLVTEISGENSKYIEQIPDELLLLAFQELLCHFYPDNESPIAKQIIRSQWYNQSFIHGSHTFIRIGTSIHDIKQLAMPCTNAKSAKPLILFAGEGTHERFYGTAHGAYLSGIREAKRIIQLYTS